MKKRTFLIMQDSTKYWTVHASVDSDGRDGASVSRKNGRGSRQLQNAFVQSVAAEPAYLAERYQDRRVFLAGDAVHLVIPTGRGWGMNSGRLATRSILGWKLEATLNGYGGCETCSHPTSSSAARSATATSARPVTRASDGGKWRSMWRPNIRDEHAGGTAKPARS